jgi:hypothetical protein
MYFKEKRKNGLALFSKTNPNLPKTDPSHSPDLPTVLPAGKLTLTTKLTQKSNRNHTKSDHFFYMTALKLIHRHTEFSFRTLDSASAGVPAHRLVRHSFSVGGSLGEGGSRQLKPKLTTIFYFLKPETLNLKPLTAVRKATEGYGRVPQGRAPF